MTDTPVLNSPAQCAGVAFTQSKSDITETRGENIESNRPTSQTNFTTADPKSRRGLYFQFASNPTAARTVTITGQTGKPNWCKSRCQAQYCQTSRLGCHNHGNRIPPPYSRSLVENCCATVNRYVVTIWALRLCYTADCGVD